MRDPTKVWETWTRSQSFGCKPSDLMRVGSPIKAFYLDRAVWMFGSKVEGQMAKAEEKTKTTQAAEKARMRVLNKHLSAGQPKQYRDPSVGTKKKAENDPLGLSD